MADDGVAVILRVGADDIVLVFVCDALGVAEDEVVGVELGVHDDVTLDVTVDVRVTDVVVVALLVDVNAPELVDVADGTAVFVELVVTTGVVEPVPGGVRVTVSAGVPVAVKEGVRAGVFVTGDPQGHSRCASKFTGASQCGGCAAKLLMQLTSPCELA